MYKKFKYKIFDNILKVLYLYDIYFLCKIYYERSKYRIFY